MHSYTNALQESFAAVFSWGREQGGSARDTAFPPVLPVTTRTALRPRRAPILPTPASATSLSSVPPPWPPPTPLLPGPLRGLRVRTGRPLLRRWDLPAGGGWLPPVWPPGAAKPSPRLRAQRPRRPGAGVQAPTPSSQIPARGEQLLGARLLGTLQEAGKDHNARNVLSHCHKYEPRIQLMSDDGF